MHAQGGTDADVTIVEIAARRDIESFRSWNYPPDASGVWPENTVFVHVTWSVDRRRQELKTKPTQHSVKELLSIGIQPDICSAGPIASFSRDQKQDCTLLNLEERAVIAAKDVASIYEVL